ncbi:MAG: hypothetical protein GWP08_16615 [Nitrospiraceae bacterium]|nr:hypothetical protein [Nitrospiraceae bacterium]
MKRSIRGYILVEAVMAMGLLSVGLVAIQGSMRQSIMTRGIARDYTHVRFLLENILAHIELQPLLTQDSDSGQFEGADARFGWEWEVSKIDLPEPQIPLDIPEEERTRFELQVDYVTKIRATVTWKRSGQEFSETVETIWLPDKLFVPEDEFE